MRSTAFGSTVWMAVQLWACSALALAPGADFGVEVVWPPFLQRIADVGPSEISFRVSGCDSFELIGVANATPGEDEANSEAPPVPETSASVAYETAPSGFLARVPVRNLVAPGRVILDAERPYRGDFALRVRCTADGRQATSVAIPVTYAPADKFHGMIYGKALSMHTTGDPNLLLTVTDMGVELMDARDFFRPRRDAKLRLSSAFGIGNYAYVRAGATAYLSDACAFPHCHDAEAVDPVTQVVRKGEASYIYELDLRPEATLDDPLAASVFEVPGSIMHMVAGQDGTVSILSDTFASSQSHDLIVSRIVDGVLSTAFVLSGERIEGATAVSGQSQFLTRDASNRVRLRDIDSASHAYLVSGDATSGEYLALAPNGRQWIVLRGGDLFVDEAGHAPRLLTQDFSLEDYIVAPPVAFLGDRLAVKAVDRHLGGASNAPLLLLDLQQPSAAPVILSRSMDSRFKVVGNRLAVVEANTLSLFDGTGHRVGGATFLSVGDGSPASMSIDTVLQSDDGAIVWSAFKDYLSLVFRQRPPA